MQQDQVEESFSLQRTAGPQFEKCATELASSLRVFRFLVCGVLHELDQTSTSGHHGTDLLPTPLRSVTRFAVL